MVKLITKVSKANLPSLVLDIKNLQRTRSVLIKSRNMVANRLTAIVAGTIGYSTELEDKDRKAKFVEAGKLIATVLSGEVESTIDNVIKATMVGVTSLEHEKDQVEKQLIKKAKLLHVAAWTEQPAQRGFGILSLGTIVGEVGNFWDYPSPCKVWRRMGLAPWTYDDKTLMGATWKSGREGKLPAEEWESFGYSPRRRSISYLIGEALVKCNERGPYRTRYLEAKTNAYHAHPEWDWKQCDKCKGKASDCETCGGGGYKCLRAHRHGMTCATKLILKRLWQEWRR